MGARSLTWTFVPTGDPSESYTWLDAEDEATGEQLVRRPEHSGSITLGYEAGPATALLIVSHTGARNDVTDLFPYGIVRNGAYTTADVVVHYSVGTFRPFLKVENLTGERYEEAFGYPSPTRRAIVGIRYGIGN